MPVTRQFTVLYGVIAGVLAAIGVVVLLVGTGFVNSKNGSQSSALSSSPVHITSAQFAILVVVSGIIFVAGLLALGSYWRVKNTAANIAYEKARRVEIGRTLKRLRDRMSLPSLVELNSLTLTEYHSIATNQAQKSFRSSQRAMLGGFIWLIVCSTAIVFVGSLNGKIIAAAMAPVGSVLAAFLGRTYLFVYERALAQLSQYYNQPLLNSYYLAAERLAIEMSPEARDRLIGNVVEQLLAAARNLSERTPQANAAHSRIRALIPDMRRMPAGEDDGKDHPALTTPAG